jgi:flagellar hook assembly protein FlgD
LAAGASRAQATAVAAPTPSGGAQIAVNLSSDARVTVEVLNLAGICVRRVCTDRMGTAGTTVLLWDGRSEGGTRAPGGRYLVRVTARRSDGGQAQVVAPLMVAQ